MTYKTHRPHILTCTAHQMAILSLFNRKGPLTIREVVERLGATDDEAYIRGVLESLVHKFKLLKLPDSKKDKVTECSADLTLTLFRKWKIDKKKFSMVDRELAKKKKKKAEL